MKTVIVTALKMLVLVTPFFVTMLYLRNPHTAKQGAAS
jgi:hypothetical protein